MISRYRRKPVAHNLHSRGVSHTVLDHHPAPEEAHQECKVSPRDLQDPHQPPATCTSSGPSSAERSPCPSAVAVETSRTWSGIDSYTGTGVSTERSSVFSWAYDEFDKAASRQVQQLFEEIDEELYEGTGGVQQDECKQWASRFPHLRILGKQLVCPTDEGFQWICTSPQSSSSTTHTQNKHNELCVQGHTAALCVEVTHNSELPRVIEEEGTMEEYLAFECRDLEEQCVCVSRRSVSLPPVSPYGCRKEAVLDLLFDGVWGDLIGWMEELLLRLWEGSGSDEEKSLVSLSPAHHPSHNSSALISSTRCTLPPLCPPTQHPNNPLHTPSTVSKGSKSRRKKSKKQRKTSTSSRASLGSAGLQHHTLSELIVIHGIPLQQRHSAMPERNTHDEDETLRPRPRHSMEQSPSPLPRPPPSSRRRPLPPRILLPLSQSSTAGNMEEIIRGTRLAPAPDRLSSPVMTLSRNTLLPPISTADPEHTHSSHHTHLFQRLRAPSSRAHSAVADEASNLLPFSRPNTTHTFRSDTPYRRSFTVLDRAGRASVGTGSLGIGVTGTSLGISSSSLLDSFTHHAHDHSPIRNGKDPEVQTPPPPVLLAPVSVRSHTRGGIMTRSNRPGP